MGMTRVDIPRRLAWGISEKYPAWEVYEWITERTRYSKFKYKSLRDDSGTTHFYLEFEDPKLAMLFKLTWF